MATIKPFRAIHPNPFYADQLVFTKPQVESVSGKTTDPQGLPPLKTLLETGARQRPETPEGQAHAYQDINNNLRELLNSEKLFLDQEPGIFVYEVKHPGYCQTGIWALTDLHDTIKTHELTFADSVRRIKNFRENTGLEGNPILLTYKQDDVINKIISGRKLIYPNAHYESASGHHHLWKIEDTETLGAIVAAFAKIDKVYLADGHHRKQSAEDLANEQAKTDGPVFNTISSL